MANKPTILLTLDGSSQSMAAVHYTSQMMAAGRVAVELFHVRTDAPEAIHDLVGDQESSLYAKEIGEWAEQASSHIHAFAEKARQVLVASGFPAEDVHTVLQPRQAGIARDILQRSSQGYAAVMCGRQGYGALTDFMLGSIAAKLAETVSQMPLIIVGTRSENKKVLVAFDRSRRIRQGLDRIGPLLARDLDQILLCHIVRPLTLPSPVRHCFNLPDSEHWVDENTRRIIPEMVAAKKRLTQAGLDPERFKTAILREKSSRAKGIFEEADSMGYGTIIIGRKGLTGSEPFSMGRVTRKLLHLALGQVIWIV